MIIPPNITVHKGGVEIQNSELIKGRLSNQTMGEMKTNSVVHAVWNQYGAYTCRDFLNDSMEITNRYLMIRGMTVGIRDIITKAHVQDLVLSLIQSKHLEVSKVFHQVESGTSLYDIEGAENIAFQKLSSVLGNIGSIIGSNLEDTNNVFAMGKGLGAGSKGSTSNLGQMSGCVSLQSYVRPSGTTRIPKDYNQRSLPHFWQNDDSLDARGFCSNSFLEGLRPHEFIFHCQTGRVGLIDTAVKTADTGYLQRKIIKCLEDLHVHADGVVRRANGEIVQWKYGDDGINPAKLHQQKIAIINYNDDVIQTKYGFTAAELKQLSKIKSKFSDKDNKAFVKKMFAFRTELRGSFENLFYDNGYINDKFLLPLNFEMYVDMMKFRQKKKSSLTPEHVLNSLDHFFDEKNMYSISISENEWKDKTFPLHRSEKESLRTIQCALYMFLSPRQCIIEYGLTVKEFDDLIAQIKNIYQKSIIPPGEMVGIIAAQSIGEPMTQLTLNTFHSTGIASKGTGQIGLSRFRELMRVSKNQKVSGMTIFLEKEYEYNEDKVKSIQNYIAEVYLNDLALRTTIMYDPNFKKTLEDNVEQMYYMVNSGNEVTMDLDQLTWLFRIELDRDMILEYDMSMFEIRLQFTKFWNLQKETKNKSLKQLFNLIESIAIMTNFDNDDIPVIHIRFQMAEIRYELFDQFEEMILTMFRIRGLNGIEEAIVKPSQFITFDEEGSIVSGKDANGFIIDTLGKNVDKIRDIIGIDLYRTATNDIWDTYVELGIEAARYQFIKELRRVSSEFESINYHHISLLIDFMCQTGTFTTIDRYGIQKLNIDIMAKCSFEQTTETLMQGAFYGVKDKMESVSSNIMVGNLCRMGTGMIDILMDTDALVESQMLKTTEEENVVLIEGNPLIDDVLSKDINEQVFVL